MAPEDRPERPAATTRDLARIAAQSCGDAADVCRSEQEGGFGTGACRSPRPLR